MKLILCILFFDGLQLIMSCIVKIAHFALDYVCPPYCQLELIHAIFKAYTVKLRTIKGEYSTIFKFKHLNVFKFSLKWLLK